MAYSDERVPNNGGSNERFIIPLLSVIISLLLVYVGHAGIYTHGVYEGETANWRLQSIAQDFVNTWAVTPFLVMSAILVMYSKKIGLLLWGGITLYLVYTFTIYCFDIHFNKLFVVYCLILGLSFYSFLYFLFTISRREAPVGIYMKLPVKMSAFYLLVLSVSFYLLWLSDVIPAIIGDSIPKELANAGLATNPVHVLDLSVILPGFFIAAVLIFRKKAIGIFLVPAILTFCVLMDITICVLAIVLNMNGMGSGYAVMGIMGTQAVISFILLVAFISAINAAVKQPVLPDYGWA